MKLYVAIVSLIIVCMGLAIVYLLSYVEVLVQEKKKCPKTVTRQGQKRHQIIKESEKEIKKEYNNIDFTDDNINMYLINMSTVKDRFNHFIEQFEKSDLKNKKLYRLEAVNGKDLPNLSDYITQKAMDEILLGEQKGHRTKHYQLTRGGVGCYLSHMMIYKHLKNSDKYHALIFEDDVIFGPNIQYQIQDLLREIPADWDIVLLGCHCIKCKKEEVNKYSKIYRFFFLHGLVVNKKGASAILRYIDDIKIEQQIDSVLSDMAEKNLINIYCAKPSIATQSHEFETSIQIPLQKIKGVDPFAPILLA